MKKYFEFAVENIAKYGDTDIFPHPIERNIFFDKKDKVVELLLKIFDSCGKDDDLLEQMPPINESMLVSSGYTGFRWATQIDPIWNAYYLGLVLAISDKIEARRIPISSKKIFSYRITLNEQEKSIFDKNYGWSEFYSQSMQNAKSYKYVLACDISHFYSSIYHHRLENSLAKLDVDDKRIEKNIMKLLQKFSDTKSYGIPVGGQASRILAELLLNRTDLLLKSRGIEFCRFVDDYHIFANTEEELYDSLLYLSTILIENEGLMLQKNKTRIMSAKEFIATSMLSYVSDEQEVDEKKNEDEKIKIDRQYESLFSLSLRFDPYSATAEEDYDKLKAEVSELKIVDLLTMELNKSRVHSSVMRRLLAVMKYLDEEVIDEAILSLLDKINILVPVFPNVMILVNNVFARLREETKEEIISTLNKMIRENHYITQIKLNLLYAIRVLANRNTDGNDSLLVYLYNTSDDFLVKRDIILIMLEWESDYWLSDLKNKYSTLNEWEKRAFIMASYTLGDEGKHWRTHNKKGFSEIQRIYLDWMSDKVNSGKGWRFRI